MRKPGGISGFPVHTGIRGWRSRRIRSLGAKENYDDVIRRDGLHDGFKELLRL